MHPARLDKKKRMGIQTAPKAPLLQMRLNRRVPTPCHLGVTKIRTEVPILETFIMRVS